MALDDEKRNVTLDIIFVAATAFAVRAAFTFLHGRAALVAEMNAYWEAAGGLVAGAGFNTGHGFRAFFPPGYAAFLAVIRYFGGGPLVARVAQAALGGCTAAFVYIYARRAFSRRTAWLAAWAFTLWPPSLIFGDFLLTEALFTFLFMAGLVTWGDGSRWRGTLATGFIWGLGALTRELAVYFMPFVTICYLLTRRYNYLLKALLASVIVFLCITPWTARNYRVLGGVVPVTTKSGVDFFIYNHNNFDQIIRNESDQPSELKLFADASSELELSRLARRRALNWIIGHPALFLFKGVRTEMNFLGLERDFFQHQLYGYFPPLPRAATLTLVPVFLLPSALAIPLAFIAALRWRANPPLAAGVYVIILYVIVTFIAYSFTRQRYPLTPVGITLAAAAAVDFRGTLSWLKRRPWAVAATAFFLLFLAAAWSLEIYLDLGDYAAAAGVVK